MNETSLLDGRPGRSHAPTQVQAQVQAPADRLHAASSFSSASDWRFLSRFVLRSPGLPFSTLAPLCCEQTYRAVRQPEQHGDAQAAVFQAELDAGRAELLRLARDAEVQGALFLSSPDFVHNNLGKYIRLATAAHRNADMRRIERRLFSYLQRLVAKNETTSAYGPLNYGSFESTGHAAGVELAYAPGALVQRRTVFLAFWAVQALAQAVAGEPALQPDLPLRLHPMATLLPGSGLQLRRGGAVLSLSPALQHALARIDGCRGAAQLETGCAEADRPSLRRLLAALLDKGALLRGPFVASSELHLLQRLQADVAALPPSAPRLHWLDRLAAWQDWCRAMSQAPLQERIVLVARALQEFTAQTGLPATRGQGEMYADRTIYYEEALGNVARLSFGAQAHDAVRRRLRGALELCAAAGHHEWSQLRALGADCWRALSPDGRPVPLDAFVAAVNQRHAAYPAIEPAPVVQRLRAQVQRMAAFGGASVVEIDSARLAIPEVEQPLYALPDMFLAAASEQALREGRFELFLGKVHHHLLVPGWLTTFIDDEASLKQELAQALAGPGLDRLAGLELLRRNKGFYAFPGPRITFAEEPACDAPEPRLPMRDMEVVLDAHGQLALRAPGREGLHLYLTLADHARYAPFAMLAWPWLAQLDVDLGPHTPRIVVDGVVIQRERWTLQAAEVPPARGEDEFAAFQHMVRWAALQGLPRHVYVRGVERKPVYVDFAIPQCHALLRSVAEGARTLRVEEMYPAPEGLWLNSARGGFTCELRACVLKRPADTLE